MNALEGGQRHLLVGETDGAPRAWRVLVPVGGGDLGRHGLHPRRAPGGEVRHRHARGLGRAVGACAGLGKVLLVVVLCVVEEGGVDDLVPDLPQAVLGQLLLVRGLRGLGQGLLLRRGSVDAGAVLGAPVVALAHALGGVVRLKVQAQEVGVGHLLRVVHHLHGLGVAGLPAADLLVRGVLGEAIDVADRGGDHARHAPIPLLRPPEAPGCEDGDVIALGERRLHGLPGDEVLGRHAQGGATPHDGLLRGHHLGLAAAAAKELGEDVVHIRAHHQAAAGGSRRRQKAGAADQGVAAAEERCGAGDGCAGSGGGGGGGAGAGG
mmetsp:Transcript_44465/g.141562  ORF Transcript_44465/g.141562 Transcript_44465/m.141562 type:complete len:322 (-) Transcript_44465:72-1037(-)